MTRLGPGLILMLHFLWQVVSSGLSTAWLVLRPRRPAPGLVRLRYQGLSDVGVVVLGCLVTLTPGTTLIDIDTERQELLLHLLDTHDLEATAASIRDNFERPLQRLHPARSSP